MDVAISYKTMHQNSTKYMLNFVEEYEQIKAGQHPKYKYARHFFSDQKICFQNFYKFYNRYIAVDRNPAALMPLRRGPKPKYLDMPNYDKKLVDKVLQYRSAGHNKYIIAESLKREQFKCSASTVYRIYAKYGLSRLTKYAQEDKRKLIREKAGSLLHIDCHYLPRGVVKDNPKGRYFAFGVIDNYSRIAWIEIIESTKALDASFAMFDSLLAIKLLYNIKVEEVLTDNGSEFCSSGNNNNHHHHPFVRLLRHFGIKHRRTRPYRPQTNGKIERLWRTFDDEVIDGSNFENLDELKDAVLGYNFYYNESRPHQGINGKLPINMLGLA